LKGQNKNILAKYVQDETSHSQIVSLLNVDL